MNDEAKKDGDYIEPVVDTHPATLQDHGVGSATAPLKPYGENASSDDAAVAEVEDGKVDEVLEAVGDDPAKARFALDRENAADKPRVSLVGKLEHLLENAGEKVAKSFNEDSSLDELVDAARSRGINVPPDTTGLDPRALHTVLTNVDAASAASENAIPPEQLDIEREVEREAGYQRPEYAKAQEQGFFGDEKTDNGDSYPEPGNAIRQPGIV